MPSMTNASVDQIVAEKCGLFAELFRSGQIDRLVEVFYTPDAVLEGQDLLPQRGRRAIAAVFKDVRSVYAEIIIDQHEPVVASGDLAYGNVSNTNICVDGSLEVHRGLMVWRRVEGSWFVERDFFFRLGEAAGASMAP